MFRNLVSGLAQGIAAWLQAPTAVNLASITADKTGTGSLVFSNSPVFDGTVTVTTAAGNYFYKAQASGASTVGWGIAILTDGTFDIDILGVSQVFHIASTNGAVSVLSAEASSSTATGALIVAGGVGVGGALNIGGLLTASGGLALTVITPSQIVSNQNNYSPTGLASAGILELQTDASRDITGLSATGITNGQVISINNVGGFNIVLKNLSASSSAANQFVCPGLADYTLTPNNAIRFYYSTSIWRTY